MANLSSLDQAQHNESVCNYLSQSQNKEYSDWVVTTAFYSSIHYIRHFILPFDEGGRTYTTFDALYEDKKSHQEGRHGFQLNLVKRFCPKVAYEYQRLLDMSTNARYHNYKYQKREATMAKSYLQDIISFVEGNKK